MKTLLDSQAVLTLFLIPVGGGIPGGVLLAQSRGLAWPLMMILYFISDVILACVLEPVMKILFSIFKNVPAVTRFKSAFGAVLKKSTAHYGTSMGPLALIAVSFGVDPMTGRAAAAAAGHGFVNGWLLAIAGDMIYFSVIMVSTLWLRSVLGDGTWTMMIILFLMLLGPVVVGKVREGLRPKSS